MIGLLRITAALPRPRHCGATLVVGGKWIKQIPGVARSSNMERMAKTSETMESRLIARDMIPPGFRLIYRGNMDSYIHLAHQSSMIMTFFGVVVVYHNVFIQDEPVQFPLEAAVAPIGIQTLGQLIFMYAGFFAMMFALRQISSRYVLRMYYNPETQTYKAVKIGMLPMATRCYDFQAGTLTRQTKRYIIPWRNGTYNVNGVKLLISAGCFRTSADFYRMFKN